MCVNTQLLDLSDTLHDLTLDRCFRIELNGKRSGDGSCTYMSERATQKQLVCNTHTAHVVRDIKPNDLGVQQQQHVYH